MRIGIIYTAYNSEEYLTESISPWITSRFTNLDGHDFVISAVSLPFKNFPEQGQDSTTDKLRFLERSGEIDKVFTEPRYINEWGARDLSLQYLLKEGCEVIIQVDADEIFTIENISNILKYIEKDKLIAWYRISYKNYVFNKNTSLLDSPFTPPRIHRVNIGKWRINKFTYDNDVNYLGKYEGEEINQNILASKVIPQHIAFPRHFTWLDGTKSKNKVIYHNLRWGSDKSRLLDGDGCSYLWNEEKNALQFNIEWYKKRNLNVPKLDFT